MKKFYKTISALFAMMACIGVSLAESGAVVPAICAVAYAVLSVGEDA